MIPIAHLESALSTNTSTTTIRLPDDLKVGTATLAKSAGITAHGFILEAIAEKTALSKQRAYFDVTAQARLADIVTTGNTIPWQEMRGYLQARIAGKTAKRPVERKLTR